MASKKMEPGTVRIGHTQSGSTGTDEVIVAEFNEQGVQITWPRALGFVEAFHLNEVTAVPEPLILRDGDGWLTLMEGRSLGASASTLGHSEERIQYARTVQTGSKGIQ